MGPFHKDVYLHDCM